MYYKKLKAGETVIEFHSNWLGQESIIVNGQIVSKKSSIMGTDHHFTLTKNGQQVEYILTSKVNGEMKAFLDLKKDGTFIKKNIEINYGFKPRTKKNHLKNSGMQKIIQYDIQEGILDLSQALEKDAKDPEIYFYLACGYSIQENALEGFECLKLAVENNLQNTEVILNHEMLAYLRMREGFEDFLNTNFTEYDEEKLS